jgi:hypothetical protein
MDEALQRHVSRLTVVCAALVGSVAVYGALTYLVRTPPAIPLAQAEHLLWALVVVALLNLITLTPVHRAMLAGPLRVYAAGREPEPLLQAHFVAHLVLFARLEAIAILGLVLYFVSGRVDWFWSFAAIASAGMVLLWPTAQRVKATLGL